MTDIKRGPLWAARNWSADAGAGSIHDDATATELGFRGGTVAGDIHMNQFPPVHPQGGLLGHPMGKVPHHSGAWFTLLVLHQSMIGWIFGKQSG